MPIITEFILQFHVRKVTLFLVKMTCLLSLLCSCEAHFLPCHPGPAVEVEHRLGLAPLAPLFSLECRVGEYCGSLVLTPLIDKAAIHILPQLAKEGTFPQGCGGHH